MSSGRLYQGKYVPPERVDGLLPLKEEGEEEREEGEEGEEERIVEAQELDLDWVKPSEGKYLPIVLRTLFLYKQYREGEAERGAVYIVQLCTTVYNYGLTCTLRTL